MKKNVLIVSIAFICVMMSFLGLYVVKHMGNKKTEKLLSKAYMYYKEASYKEAVEYYVKAAERGSPLAQRQLGLIYRHGRDNITQSYEKSLKYYKDAARTETSCDDYRDIGDIYAETQGLSFYDKKYISNEFHSYYEAMKWYEKAAACGDWIAMGNIGDMYFNGNGVKQDYDIALKWYTKEREAAKDLSYVADISIGNIYIELKKYKEAIELYNNIISRARKDFSYNLFTNGWGEANVKLGDMYYEGKGLKKDYKQALEYYKKAAKLSFGGDVRGEALLKIGDMYEYGYGGTKNNNEALKYWKASADLNNQAAKFRITLNNFKNNR
jgi:TPR repeat protein